MSNYTLIVTLTIIGMAVIVMAVTAFWHRYFLLGIIAGQNGLATIKNRLAELIAGRDSKDAVEAVQSNVWDICNPKPRFIAEDEKSIMELQLRIKTACEQAVVAVAAVKRDVERMKDDAHKVFAEFKGAVAHDDEYLKTEIKYKETAYAEASRTCDEKIAELAEARRNYDCNLNAARAVSISPKLWSKVAEFATKALRASSNLVYLSHVWPLLAVVVITAADFLVRYTLTINNKGSAILQDSATKTGAALFTVLLLAASATFFELIIWGLKKNGKEKWAAEAAQYGFVTIVGLGIIGLVGVLITSTMSIPKQIEGQITSIAYTLLFLALAFAIAFILNLAQWDKIRRALVGAARMLAYVVTCACLLVASCFEFLWRLIRRNNITVDGSDLQKASELHLSAAAKAQKLEAELQNLLRRNDAAAIELKTKLQRDLQAIDAWSTGETKKIEFERDATVTAAEQKIEGVKNNRYINGFRTGVKYAVIKKLRLQVIESKDGIGARDVVSASFSRS